MQSSALGPVLTAHLFPKIDAMLIELLESLTDSDWGRPTLVPRWTVKHIAAHLLDTGLRRLSNDRDGYPTAGKSSDIDLVAFINRVNHEGVELYSRLSPRVLISLMKTMCPDLHRHLASLDPFAEGLGVSWAGEERSPNWFDVAREFTERWHHQQQIRTAVNTPGLMMRELYHPVLDCFMRALPHHYRRIEAEADALVVFHIGGDCGGRWYLLRDANAWKLVIEPCGNRVAEVSISQDIAWQVFTKGKSKEAAAAD
jgi:uncharacterized protein (TIGR03083 family)